MQSQTKRLNSIKKWIWVPVLLLMLWVLPGLFSLQGYVKQAEQAASGALGVPVTIAHAQWQLLPSPRLVVSGLSIGSQQDVQVSKLLVLPHLSALWQSPRVVDVALDGVVLKKSVIAAVDRIQSQLLNTASVSPTAVLVAQVKVNHLDVRSFLPLSLLEARVNLAHNAMQSLHVQSQDDSLQLDLVPEGELQQIALALKSLVLPNHNITITQGQVQATLRRQSLRLNQIQLRLLGGLVDGKGQLDWHHRAKADGQFAIQGLSMQALTQGGGAAYLSGRLSGQATLHAEAAQIGDLEDRLQLQAGLEVKDGVLHGLDLIKIAELMLKQDERGGETQFDTLRTALVLQGNRLQFKQMDVQSGLMIAKGNVTVVNGKQLSGALHVAIKETAALLAVPLEISGTVDHPTVLPDKAATIGAVVGTAILPGVGTGLGIKAGSALKGLFGGK